MYGCADLPRGREYLSSYLSLVLFFFLSAKTVCEFLNYLTGFWVRVRVRA